MELLDAETAADIGRHDAHLVLRQLQHQRAHQEAHDMGKLAGGPQRVVALARIIFGNRRPRLHRIADQTIVDQAQLGDMRRLAERRLHRGLIAELPVAADIVRDVVEQLRRVGPDRIEHADDRGQHLIVDIHQLRRRLRLFERLGDDEGHHVADEAHLALRQHREWRLFHRDALGVADAPAAGQRAQAVGCDILAGQHRDHARRRQRGGFVDAAQHGMGMRRTDENTRRHARPLDVRHVVAAPGEEALIFLALRRRADPDHLPHGHSPADVACMAAAPAMTAMTMF